MSRKMFLLVLFFPINLFAQYAGISSFAFINLETSPRILGLGGNSIAIYDDDLSIAQTAPSLLNSSMDNQIVFSFTDYISDINLLGFSYAKEINDIGVMSVGVKIINYGTFYQNDHFGNTNGTFSAHDQSFTIGLGRRLNQKLSIGVNLNMLNSQYETYSSFGVAANLSTTYIDFNRRLTSTLLFKNIGRQLNTYANEKEDLPFDIQFAISKELKHLPFRYHLSYTNLHHFDIKSPYKLNTHTNLQTGELEVKQETLAKTFLRHVVIGGELNPFRRNIFLRGGFDFQRRFDMTLVSRPLMVGFSFGFGFKLYKFNLDYSRSSYHLIGFPNSFSISTNISTFNF